jgi:hypothetical protein
MKRTLLVLLLVTLFGCDSRDEISRSYDVRSALTRQAEALERIARALDRKEEQSDIDGAGCTIQLVPGEEYSGPKDIEAIETAVDICARAIERARTKDLLREIEAREAARMRGAHP